MNKATGYSALFDNTTGSNNIAIGASAGSGLTAIGLTSESNTIRIGKAGTQTAAFIAGIRGTTVAGGIAVLVDANGRLGTTTSSARIKENIKPMSKASEAILSLQPVTFRYKKDLDPDGIPQFGLVAEEVAKVNPDLVVRDDQGKPYTVRYEAVNAMLLNEFLKAHRTIESQPEEIKELRVALTAETRRAEKEIATLREGLGKVSARLEKSAAGGPLVATVEE